MRSLRLPAAILLCLLLLSATAGASTITVTGIGFGRTDVALLVDGSATPTEEYAVEINITKDAIDYIAYCIDFYTGIGLDDYNTTTGLPDSYLNGERAAWIYENYAPFVTSNSEAAALQVAIWDVVHDGGDGLTFGNIQLDGASESVLTAEANAIVQASAGQSSQNATILYNTVISTGAPAQSLITSAAAYDAVPEPGSVALFGAGLVALCALRRRRSLP